MVRAGVVVFAAAAVAGAAQASTSFANGGFENQLAGWTASGPGVVATPMTVHINAQAPNGPVFTPVAGDYHAELNANAAAAPVTLSQSFDVSGAWRLTGWAAFLAQDAMEDGFYDDYGFVRLTEGVTIWQLFGSDVAAVGGYGYTPWTAIASDQLAGGHYTLTAGVVNADDNFNPSRLLVDSFQVVEAPAAIPEPGAWTLMIGGALGAGAALRLGRRRRATG